MTFMTIMIRLSSLECWLEQSIWANGVAPLALSLLWLEIWKFSAVLGCVLLNAGMPRFGSTASEVLLIRQPCSGSRDMHTTLVYATCTRHNGEALAKSIGCKMKADP
jgi:hypothetical protein